MPKIFISYRREDSEYPALHIYDKLVEHFGKESVVFDVDTIPFGIDFRDYLSREVSKCDILLVVIGDRWIDILEQRLKEPNDFVRIEIQVALERDIPVVPVLVKNASVPSAADLPPEISELAYKQAAEVRAGSDYKYHLKRLINGLENSIAGRPSAEDSGRVGEKGAEPSPPKSAEKMEKHNAEHPSSEPAVEEPPARDETPTEIDKSHIGRKTPALVFAVAALLVCLAAVIWFYLSSWEDHLAEIITNSIGMKFALIPAGSFTMGSPESEAGRSSNETQHFVTITRPFYMQTTEVTQGQWKKLMGDNPSHFKDCGDDCPVEKVLWEDAQNFIEKLNAKEGVTHYRLPTEAEWEYAVRAGTTTAFSFGDDLWDTNAFAWYIGNSEDQTHPVGAFKPNPWGLYDMHGNVSEWVEDWHADYPAGSVVDPKGPQSGSHRVIRSGSWANRASTLRSARRRGLRLDEYGELVGFRLARSVSLDLWHFLKPETKKGSE